MTPFALLLPENTTPRYESADKPYFEAEVARLAPQCKVLYFNAANTYVVSSGADYLQPKRKFLRELFQHRKDRL